MLQHPPSSLLKLGSTLLAGLLLTGCLGDERSTSATPSTETLKVNTPADITNTSADNYDNNVNGLITHNTLKRWIDDWEANRPAGINGKLVIIQQSTGPTGAEFIKPDNQHVFTYVNSAWREARSNGVITIGGVGPGGIVLSGTGIDNLIKRFGIDVHNDLIVCAQGGSSTDVYMNQGRCWYTFSYWGVDQKNLAVLNGNNSHLSTAEQLGANYFTSTKIDPTNQTSPIINRQVSSVKDLKVDNTLLYASLEDLINVLPIVDEPVNNDGVFLWDGRSVTQFSAGLQSWSPASGPASTLTNTALPNRYNSFQNNAPRQSHPRGTHHLQWDNLITTGTGLYHDKATLAAILSGGTAPSGQSFVVGGLTQDYQVAGEGNAWQPGDIIYHFCETSARSGVTLVTAAVILGIPSRLYDSGLVEWNSLTAGAVDKNGNSILPAGSPWDTSSLSFPWFENQATGINPRTPAGWAEELTLTQPDPVTAEDVIAGVLGTPLITNPYAENTLAIPTADRAYKAPPVTEPETGNGGGNNGGGSGGGILLPNPCG